VADDDLLIAPGLRLPRRELIYRASRAGGPGGQHVNTSSTRIELWWDIAGSPSLTEAQRQRLLTRLATRVDSSGALRLVAAGSRSQLQNREEVTARFQKLVAQGLAEPKVRKRTRPTKASKERRLEQKRQRARQKRERRRRPNDE
jgi:ribosome-associated protein